MLDYYLPFFGVFVIFGAIVLVATFGKRLRRRPKRTVAVGAAFLAVIGVFFVTVFLVNRHQEQRAVETWRSFARELGLEHNGEDFWEDQRVVGRVDGRRVKLWAMGPSSSTSHAFGSTQSGGRSSGSETIEVEIRGVPKGLGLHVGAHSKPLRMPFFEPDGAPQFRSGDDGFDDAVRVMSTDWDAARAWLTEARRAAVLEHLAKEHRFVGGTVSQSIWRVELHELRTIYEGLRRLAEAVEAAGPSPSTPAPADGEDE